MTVELKHIPATQERIELVRDGKIVAHGQAYHWSDTDEWVLAIGGFGCRVENKATAEYMLKAVQSLIAAPQVAVLHSLAELAEAAPGSEWTSDGLVNLIYRRRADGGWEYRLKDGYTWSQISHVDESAFPLRAKGNA